ncbi:hypothetical protein AMK59_2073, partial [Oryctes borbonicus]
ETDAEPLGPSNDAYEIEGISIEFPTELIPDEYEHDNSSNGLVYVLRDDGNQTQILVSKLVVSLKCHGYNVPPENLMSANNKDELSESLQELSNKDFTNDSCLILFIIGNNNIFNDLRNGIATKIWSPFIDNKSLKYKPKIFFFYEYEKESNTQTDSRTMFDRDKPYDVPSEADVLIVYQKSCIPKKKNGFLEEFCDKLKEYGERDDIMGLLTHTEYDPRPLIISTLRKKFYISSSNFREHFFDIESYNRRVLETLKSLQTRMEKIVTSGKNPLRTSRREDESSSASYNTLPKQAKTEKTAKNLIVSDGPRNRRYSSTSSIAKREKEQSEPKKRWMY